MRRWCEPSVVTVVMPAFNAGSMIDGQLAALAAQTYTGEWEVVVADNGSTDDTSQRCAAFLDRLPRLRVVDASDRPGANHARNCGARAAAGDLLAFCDADDVADAGWLDALVRAAAGGDAVGGKLDGSEINDPSTAEWRHRLQSESLPTSWDFLPYAMGANAAVWVDAFVALDGFDESFRYGSDDVDFFWRLQLGGYRLVFAEDAVMSYRHRDSLRSLARQHYLYGLSEPLRYRRYRSLGARARSPVTVAREYSALLASAPFRLASRPTRGEWVRMASLRAGRVVGSVRERAVYL